LRVSNTDTWREWCFYKTKERNECCPWKSIWNVIQIDHNQRLETSTTLQQPQKCYLSAVRKPQSRMFWFSWLKHKIETSLNNCKTLLEFFYVVSLFTKLRWYVEKKKNIYFLRSWHRNQHQKLKELGNCWINQIFLITTASNISHSKKNLKLIFVLYDN
jgi:hypothetical protein